MVEVDDCREEGEVLVRRVVRFVSTSASMRRKGRYLFPALEEGRLLEMPFCFSLLSLRRLVGSERFSSALSTSVSACRFDRELRDEICSIGVGYR